MTNHSMYSSYSSQNNRNWLFYLYLGFFLEFRGCQMLLRMSPSFQCMVWVHVAGLTHISFRKLYHHLNNLQHLTSTCVVKENLIYSMSSSLLRHHVTCIYSDRDVLHVVIQQTHLSRVNLFHMLHVWQYRTCFALAVEKYVVLTLATCESHQSKPRTCSWWHASRCCTSWCTAKQRARLGAAEIQQASHSSNVTQQSTRFFPDRSSSSVLFMNSE